MTLKRKAIRKSLLKKGFVEKKKTKHVFYQLYHGGFNTGIQTFVSRGSDNIDISGSLEADMARQCRISIDDFRRLIECSVSENDYYNLVKKYIE